MVEMRANLQPRISTAQTPKPRPPATVPTQASPGTSHVSEPGQDGHVRCRITNGSLFAQLPANRAAGTKIPAICFSDARLHQSGVGWRRCAAFGGNACANHRQHPAFRSLRQVAGGQHRSSSRWAHDQQAPVSVGQRWLDGGLSLSGLGAEDLLHPATLGVAAGLFLGKPIGIIGFVGVAVLLRLVALPRGVTWAQIIGVSFACGIGFIMSLFVAGLAFEHGSGDYFAGDRLGILIGSFASAAAAYLVLRLSLRYPRESA